MLTLLHSRKVFCVMISLQLWPSIEAWGLLCLCSRAWEATRHGSQKSPSWDQVDSALQFSSLDFSLSSTPSPFWGIGHPGAYLLRLKTAHPHVLLPLTLGHHPTCPMPPTMSPRCWQILWVRKNHLLCSLHYADIFVPGFCCFRYLIFGGDGLWQVCICHPLHYTLIMSWRVSPLSGQRFLGI